MNKPVTLIAPEFLNFSCNHRETIQFFIDLKSAIFRNSFAIGKGSTRPQPVAIDLSKVTDISVPAAVVLAAELHRWHLYRKGGFNAKGNRDWSPIVQTLLRDLGVFELLGENSSRLQSSDHKELVLLRLQSDTRRDGPSIAKLQTWFQEIGVVFGNRKFVFGALDEAVLNSLDHGYIDLGQKPKFPYAGHRWWATSCYDPNDDSLRFFVYDQGVGIPACLPSNREFWPHVYAKIKAGIVGEGLESNIIESAFEVGRTRTHMAERGKGLDKMRDAIRLSGDGYLRIISGKGDLSLSGDRTLAKRDHDLHIGGTLVEWSIPLNALKGHGASNG